MWMIIENPALQKRPPRNRSWWPSFCVLKSVLNTSINNKPILFSPAVISGNLGLPFDSIKEILPYHLSFLYESTICLNAACLKEP